MKQVFKILGKDESFIKPDNKIYLTNSEKKVLEYISNGFSIDEMADILSVNKDIIERDKKTLLSKTKAKSYAHLIMIAVSEGLISIL